MGLHRWKRAALAVVAVCGLTGGAARADDATAWLKDRESRFAAYQGAIAEAKIATLKARTAALVAAGPPASDLQSRLDQPPIIWRASDTPLTLWDGPEYPEMVVVPAGEYTMGSPDSEAHRDKDESPRHRVRVGYSFAVGKFAVTVGEFERFVAETGFNAGEGCFNMEPGAQPHADSNFRRTGFDQTIDDPVVCMNETNAQAYVAWLSKKTGHLYRLLSEAEFEYAARAGSMSAFWWGDDGDGACAHANGADADTKARFPQLSASVCHDGYAATAPVGRFPPNAFGLYDMAGNAWSILADCWTPTYDGAPTDGAANLGGGCARHALRGGPWLLTSTLLRSALRGSYATGGRYVGHGFRVARTL